MVGLVDDWMVGLLLDWVRRLQAKAALKRPHSRRFALAGAMESWGIAVSAWGGNEMKARGRRGE